MFELVVAAHFAFVVWVAAGGILALKWGRLAVLHLPALLWAILLEWNGWICPLTPLENSLRPGRGLPVYHAGFIENYLVPVIYPGGLTREIQAALAVGLVLVNAVIYGALVHKQLKHARREKHG